MQAIFFSSVLDNNNDLERMSTHIQRQGEFDHTTEELWKFLTGQTMPMNQGKRTKTENQNSHKNSYLCH